MFNHLATSLREIKFMNNLSCPLCSSNQTIFLCSKYITWKFKHEREFFLCEICNLIFVPKKFHLSEKDQINRYLQHNNTPEDLNYRKFLSKLLTPLVQNINPKSHGLDYGSGPGPTLSIMLEEIGFNVAIYDIYFSPNTLVLDKQYDFITCTETSEHFSTPKEEFENFQKILKPKGYIGIMTSMIEDPESFLDWYYNRDPTHISFYSKKTMSWIAKNFNWTIKFSDSTVTLFKKS